MVEHEENIYFLRSILGELLVEQSSPRLGYLQMKKCKKKIRALKEAIETMEFQVHA